MTQTLVRLRDGVQVRRTPDGRTVLASPTSLVELGTLDADETKALHEEREPDSIPAALLAKLRESNALAYTLRHNDRTLLTVQPNTSRAPNLGTLLANAEPPSAPAKLSRFAVVRQTNTHFEVESPRSDFTAELTDPALLRLDEPTVAAVLQACGLATTGDEPSLWEPHELWFHSRSRLGHHEHPWGATTRGTAPPVHQSPTKQIALPTGSPEDPMTLTEALETRKSVRTYAPKPLTQQQLGEFLFRTARSRGVTSYADTDYDDRPYPSGGRLYELEIYPVVTNVEGLEPGLYRYSPAAHHLIELDARPAQITALARGAAAIASATTPPPVLFVITARFDRVLWKYQSMAYALILKNVGVLMQTMYLVATAMNLAPCALGGGDSDLFGTAAGLDREQEASVGEFMLGVVEER